MIASNTLLRGYRKSRMRNNKANISLAASNPLLYKAAKHKTLPKPLNKKVLPFQKNSVFIYKYKN